MPASPLTNLSRCAIHTQTNKPWTLQQCIDDYSKAGIGGISGLHVVAFMSKRWGVTPLSDGKSVWAVLPI